MEKVEATAKVYDEAKLNDEDATMESVEPAKDAEADVQEVVEFLVREVEGGAKDEADVQEVVEFLVREVEGGAKDEADVQEVVEFLVREVEGGAKDEADVQEVVEFLVREVEGGAKDEADVREVVEFLVREVEGGAKDEADVREVVEFLVREVEGGAKDEAAVREVEGNNARYQMLEKRYKLTKEKLQGARDAYATIRDEFEKLQAKFDAQGAKLQAKFDAQAAKLQAKFDAQAAKQKDELDASEIKYQKLEMMVKSARETLCGGGEQKSACSKPSGPMGFTFGQGNEGGGSELRKRRKLSLGKDDGFSKKMKKAADDNGVQFVCFKEGALSVDRKLEEVFALDAYLLFLAECAEAENAKPKPHRPTLNKLAIYKVKPNFLYSPWLQHLGTGTEGYRNLFKKQNPNFELFLKKEKEFFEQHSSLMNGRPDI